MAEVVRRRRSGVNWALAGPAPLRTAASRATCSISHRHSKADLPQCRGPRRRTPSCRRPSGLGPWASRRLACVRANRRRAGREPRCQDRAPSRTRSANVVGDERSSCSDGNEEIAFPTYSHESAGGLYSTDRPAARVRRSVGKQICGRNDRFRRRRASQAEPPVNSRDALQVARSLPVARSLLSRESPRVDTVGPRTLAAWQLRTPLDSGEIELQRHDLRVVETRRS